MNVGILSMQRVMNYGSFLQALALKSVIGELGNKVEFIDIKPGMIYEQDFVASEKFSLECEEYNNKKRQLLEEFSTKYLNLSKEYNYRNDYDFAVIGSDEIFNCINNGHFGFNTQIYGEDVSNYTITYAASCGSNTAQKMFKYNLQNETKKALQNLKTISVRDKNTYNFIKEILGESAIENLDPVFIYDFSRYMNANFNKKDYIAVYSYTNRINDENEVNAIKEFATKNNLKTIGVGTYQEWCDENVNITPFEVLDYFKNANYVITDTFHGTVFSLKYNKKFATIIRDSNSNKLGDLLNRFELNEKIFNDIKKLDDVLNLNIEYKRINEFIKKETDSSIQYIKRELEKANEYL